MVVRHCLWAQAASRQSSHGSWWDDSVTLLLCLNKNIRENKHWRHILLQIFSGQNVGCYIIKLKFVGFFNSSRTTTRFLWLQRWRDIHVFKGKGARDHRSHWEILEINHRRPEEKSVLCELQGRCAGQGGGHRQFLQIWFSLYLAISPCWLG